MKKEKPLTYYQYLTDFPQVPYAIEDRPVVEYDQFDPGYDNEKHPTDVLYSTTVGQIESDLNELFSC